MGSEYAMILVDEATEISRDDYQALLTRMRGPTNTPYRQIACVCNPGPPHHWLIQAAQAAQMTRFVSRLSDNAMYYDEQARRWTEAGLAYRQRTLARLTGVQKLRLVDGIWAGNEGLVYELDLRQALCQPPADLVSETGESNWRIVGGIDFGFSDPAVVQAWARHRGDGRTVLLREWYRTQAGVETLLTVCRRMRKDYPGLETFVVDPSAAVLIDYLKRNGVPVMRADNDLDHVATVQRVIAQNRLFICRDYQATRDLRLVDRSRPTCLVDELCALVWDDKRDRPRSGQADHACDVMRYVCAHLERGTATWAAGSWSPGRPDDDEDD
jgi:phage terminase large subunit